MKKLHWNLFLLSLRQKLMHRGLNHVRETKKYPDFNAYTVRTDNELGAVIVAIYAKESWPHVLPETFAAAIGQAEALKTSISNAI